MIRGVTESTVEKAALLLELAWGKGWIDRVDRQAETISFKGELNHGYEAGFH